MPTLASQTPGSATAADILSGQIAWVDGVKIIGSIPTVTLTGGTDTSTGGYKATIPAAGYTGGTVQSVTIPKGTLSGGTDTSTGGYKASISKETYVGASDQSVTIPKGTLTGGTDTSTGGYKASISKETYVGASDQSVTIPKGTLSGGTDTSTGGYKATISKETYVGASDQSVTIAKGTLSGGTDTSTDGYKATIAKEKYTGASDQSITIAKGSVSGDAQTDGTFKYSIAGGKYTGASGSSGTISKLTPTYSTGSSQSSLKAGGTVTLPAGTYNKDKVTITAASLASQTGVDSGKTAVTAATMLTGYQGWVNGNKITGSMPNRGNKTASLNAGGSVTLDAGYYSGGKITANSLASQTSANATAAQILSGQTAWVNGSKVTGTMTNRGAVAPAALNAGGSYTIPAGYHNGSGKVTAASLASQTSANATAAQILSGKTAWVNGSKVTGSMAVNTYSNATSVGWYDDGTNKYGHVHFPEGYYGKAGYDWAPEIRLTKNQIEQLANDAGVVSNMIINKYSVPTQQTYTYTGGANRSSGGDDFTVVAPRTGIFIYTVQNGSTTFDVGSDTSYLNVGIECDLPSGSLVQAGQVIQMHGRWGWSSHTNWQTATALMSAVYLSDH